MMIYGIEVAFDDISDTPKRWDRTYVCRRCSWKIVLTIEEEKHKSAFYPISFHADRCKGDSVIPE